MCQFYESADDLLDIVAPWFESGLQDNEFCIWVTSRDFDPRSAATALGGRIRTLDRFLKAGQIEFHDAEQWYMPEGRFDPERLHRAWDGKLQEGLERGFAGLRINGNESWLSQDIWTTFAEYETQLDSIIRNKPMLVLCTYPLAGSSGGKVFEIAASHDFSIARRHGQWHVLESTESIGAKARVERLNLELERLVAERTRELGVTAAVLEERETMYRFLAENMNDAVMLFDMDGTTDFASPSMIRILGYAPKRIFDGVIEEDVVHARRMFERVVREEVVVGTCRYLHADGTIRWLEAAAQTVVFHEKPHILVVFRDVSDRVALEEQLRHAQKMEAIGRLAGGVAHDFNNLLTAIFGYSELALGDLPDGSPGRDSIGEIKLAAERARRVTRQLLTFSRRDVRHRQVVELASIVSGLERMLRLLVREDIDLDVQVGRKPLPVLGDPAQLEQVIVNLVSNAADATSSGGRIVVFCGREQVGPNRPAVPASIPRGDYALVRVSDTGTGMTPEVAARAFEPFFTTKAVGTGTGLGLSTVFGIVKQSGGFVWIESRDGEGSDVSVLLPLSPTPAGAPAPDEAPARIGRSLAGIRIAVVEDEDVVRHFVVDVLRRTGADVIPFASPAEALRLLAGEEVAVDLLVTDVVMPGLTGLELVEQVRKRHPALPFIFMSGYTSEEDGRWSHTATLLEKPFTPTELLDRVSQALSSDPDA